MTTRNKTSRDLFRDYGKLTFGEVLRSFRLADELTQAAFARKLGISAANLCDLEKGRKLPSPARAAKMAVRLGLPKPLLIQLALQGQLELAHLDYKVSVAA